MQNGNIVAEKFTLYFPRKHVDAPKSANSNLNPFDNSSFELLTTLIDRANAYGDPSDFIVCTEFTLLTGIC